MSSQPKLLYKRSLSKIADPSKLSFTELGNLRVDGSYDNFTAMKRMHELCDYMKYTPAQAKQTLDTMKTFYQENKWKTGIRSEKVFYMFVLRWVCRGLTVQQALDKTIVDYQQKKQFLQRKHSYYKGKRHAQD